MSKIKIMGLGGLSETGKNTYVVEVDNAIFILDCGLKFATENLYGIDYIIPDFEYLVKNKKKIKGLFLTHGHYENMGATNDLVRMIPDLKVYLIEISANKLVKCTSISSVKRPNINGSSIADFSFCGKELQ